MPCEVCGLAYAPWSARDRALHRRRHDVFLHGGCARPLSDDEVVSQVDDLRMVLVRPTASFNPRRRVQALARRANQEMYYDFGIYSAVDPGNWELQVHAFLGHIGDRAIAL